MKWSPSLICQIEGDPGGDTGGGGGGAPTSGGDAGASPSPSSSSVQSAPNPPSEPQSMSYARHSSERDPTEGEVKEVSRILDKGKDPNHTLSMDEIQALLGMPMKFKPNDPPVGEVEEKVAPVAPVVADPAKPDPAAPVAPALSPDMKALVDALKDVVGTKADPQSAPAQTEPQKPKKFYGDIKPAVEIAPQLADAIFNAESPEQARAGLNFLVSGIMNQIADDMQGQMYKMAKLMMTQMPQVASAQVESRDFSKSFYGKNPELNRDAIKPIVGQLAAAMAREYTKAGRPVGDDKFNEALADATHKFLEAQLGRSLRPDKMIPAPSPAPKKQPWIAPGGSRPAEPARNGKDDWTNLVI